MGISLPALRYDCVCGYCLHFMVRLATKVRSYSRYSKHSIRSLHRLFTPYNLLYYLY